MTVESFVISGKRIVKSLIMGPKQEMREKVSWNRCKGYVKTKTKNKKQKQKTTTTTTKEMDSFFAPVAVLDSDHNNDC